MIGFGLFHGLILLPVLLSLIGPQPFSNAQDAKKENGNLPKPSVEMQPLTLTNGAASGTSNGHHHLHKDGTMVSEEDCHNDELIPTMDPLTSITVQT